MSTRGALRLLARLGVVPVVFAIACASLLCGPSSHADWRNPQGVCKDPRGCDPAPSSSGKPSSSSSSPSPAPSVDPAEQARQQRLREAHEANDRGVKLFKEGAFAKALALFQEALDKDPGDAVIKKNIHNAKEALAKEEARRKREAESKASAVRMTQSVRDLARSLERAPTAGGLDFDGRNLGGAPKSGGKALEFTAVIAAPAPCLPSSDPKIVGLCNLPAGLPKALESAIAGAYAKAPPGVSERVRKGFQAVMTRDWKVAKAWFEDALLRDPTSPGLKRLVAIVGDPKTPAKQATPLAAAAPKVILQLPGPEDMALIFPSAEEVEMNQAMQEALERLFGLPPRRRAP